MSQWILVLMGVSGSGKTTVAHELVARTGWQFAEGDDYHSEANKTKMHAGVPLTDEDRAPWLATLHDVLQGWDAKGESGVMTCSALKQSYRLTLSAGLDARRFRFVLLDVPREELLRRLGERKGHFMNPGLLDSQLATLERPGDAMCVDATRAPGEVASEILAELGEGG
jgi:gluconokinase